MKVTEQTDKAAEKKERQARQKEKRRKRNQQRFSIWANPTDRKTIEKKAESLGLTVSEFMRTMALRAGIEDEMTYVRAAEARDAAKKQIAMTYATLSEIVRKLDTTLEKFGKTPPADVQKSAAFILGMLQQVEKDLHTYAAKVAGRGGK